MARDRNPYPHVKLRGGQEVIAWPDGVVGLHFASGFTQLYSPRSAERLAHALLKMAEAARPSPPEKQPSASDKSGA